MTDTGFKRIFGQRDYKDVLIDFLNDVFADEPDFDPIEDIEYQDKEKIKDEKRKRTIIYDILCICQSGRRFIVEMQQRKHPNFEKRAVYYISDGVCDQANTGSDWNYRLLPVYGIFISDFTLPNVDPVVKASVSLRNDLSGKLFSNITRYIFIQLPYFDMTEEECMTGFDKWIYVLKNLETMDAMPFIPEKEIFEKLKDLRDVFKMTPDERAQYKHELKQMRDLNTQFYFEREEGRAQGRVEGRAEERRTLVSTMKANGMSSNDIIKYLNLTTNEIKEYLCN